jgi:hypothetical protein
MHNVSKHQLARNKLQSIMSYMIWIYDQSDAAGQDLNEAFFIIENLIEKTLRGFVSRSESIDYASKWEGIYQHTRREKMKVIDQVIVKG